MNRRAVKRDLLHARPKLLAADGRGKNELRGSKKFGTVSFDYRLKNDHSGDFREDLLFIFFKL